MVELPKKKVGIVACSGEEMAEGTVTRLAALRVLETLRPADTVTICLLVAALGQEADEYSFDISKAESLDGSDIAFSMMQTLTMVYGFLSMGVVGLLVYSLINANVEDRRRDLAFMRVIGAQQRDLFALVLIEVGSKRTLAVPSRLRTYP